MWLQGLGNEMCRAFETSLVDLCLKTQELVTPRVMYINNKPVLY